MATSSQYAGPLKTPLNAHRGLGQKTALPHTYERILRWAIDSRKDTERVIPLIIGLSSMMQRSPEGLHDLESLHIEQLAIGEAPVDCGAPSAGPIRYFGEFLLIVGSVHMPSYEHGQNSTVKARCIWS